MLGAAALKAFQQGRYRVLVETDLASRGCRLALRHQISGLNIPQNFAIFFATLTADGYDETDRRIPAWMQAHWVAFARDGAPVDVWRPYREDERIFIVGDEDDFHQERIEDDPVVPLLQDNFRIVGIGGQTL